MKQFFSALSAVFLCLCFGICLYAKNSFRFSSLTGERCFYLDSPSSQCLIKKNLSLFDIPRVTGECVRFPLSREKNEVVTDILSRYSASVLFEERIDGVTSYYCHTGDWGGGVWLNGRQVNLHIALSDTQCAVGSPIIFGGF